MRKRSCTRSIPTPKRGNLRQLQKQPKERRRRRRLPVDVARLSAAEWQQQGLIGVWTACYGLCSNGPTYGSRPAGCALDGRVTATARCVVDTLALLPPLLPLLTDQLSFPDNDLLIQICVYGLERPCRARNVPLPTLPMPADPLDELRAFDRSARPLTQFSRLSLAGGSGGAVVPATGTSLHAWRIDARCEGREAAMLFRVEPSGEAHAWSRGGAIGGGRT